jgi:hypothetical protein
MVSAVSGASAVIPASSPTPSPTAAADKVLDLLLQSSDVLQSLASRSSFYLPPSIAQVLSTLWGGINLNNTRTIKESDLEKFVVAEGGKTSDAHALWIQLEPDGHSGSTVDAADFAFNAYLSQAISSKLDLIRASVTEIQQQQGPGTFSNLLSTFQAAGGRLVGGGASSILDIFV